MNPSEDDVKSGKREDGRRRRWAAHRRARRAAMVGAAIRAIRGHGPSVGMDDIAAEAGVSKPVLYRYFTDQADLYLAVGRNLAEDLLADITAELDREREPRALVAAVVDTYLRTIEEKPELYRFVVRRAFLDRPVEHDVVTDYGTLIATQLTRTIGDRMRALGLDSGAAEPWGHGLVGLVQAAGDWWLDHPAMSRESLTEYLTALIWNGFAGVLASAGVRADEVSSTVRLHAVPDDSGGGEHGAVP
ncbi:MAG: TetR family transcriptional regulator [Streptosporangiaceae bacterium]